MKAEIRSGESNTAQEITSDETQNMAPGEKEKPTKPKKAATSTKSPKAASKNATETENMDISDVADKVRMTLSVENRQTDVQTHRV